MPHWRIFSVIIPNGKISMFYGVFRCFLKVVITSHLPSFITYSFRFFRPPWDSHDTMIEYVLTYGELGANITL